MLLRNLTRVTTSLILLSFLISCGTARGVLHGAGTVLEGMAIDARTVGNWLE
jgi:hypothetical protein